MPGQRRAPAEICALWLGGTAPESARAEAALGLLVDASAHAVRRWPALFADPAGVRIICPAGQMPPALAEAANSSGCALSLIEAPPDFLLAQCDLAIVASPEDLPRAGLAPALVLPAKAGDVLWFDGGGARPLAAGRQRNVATLLQATTELVAAAALAPPDDPQQAQQLADYLAEDPELKVRSHGYDMLLRLIGQRAEAADAPDISWEAARAVARQARPGAAGAIEALRAAHARADAVALAFGRRWRSMLVARTFMLLLASACSGLIGALFPRLSVATIPLQVAVTALIFIEGRRAARNRWRGKWIEYRRLAETLRVGRFLALCGVAPAPSDPADWVQWMVRRASRAAAPFDAPAQAAAPAVIAYLAKVEIGGQIAYHRDALARFRRLDQGIRRAAAAALCIFATLGAALAALALPPLHLISVPVAAAIGLALVAAPALYATLNGVRRDLDVVRQAARSAGIEAELKRLAEAIENAPATVETGVAAGLRAADIMRNDVASWHGVVEVL